MTRTRAMLCVLSAAVLSAALIAPVHALGAEISWITAAVTGEESILTDGHLVTAINSGGATVTVNGVTFSGAAGNPLSGNFGSAYSTNAFSPGLNALLTGASFGPSGSTFDLTGLTAGNNYVLQLFAADDRSCCGAREVYYDNGTGDGSNNSDTLTGIGTPQYAAGFFTADGPTQTIGAYRIVTDDNNTYVNGYQLRSLEPLPPTPARTVVHGQEVIDRLSTDSFYGSAIHNTPIEDGSGDTDLPGQVVSWEFFNNNPDAAGRLITPLLVENIAGQYVVRGIGASREVSDAGLQAFDFGLVAGSDIFDWSLGTYHMALRYGTPTAANQGVVDFDGGGGSWAFLGDADPLGPEHDIVLGNAVSGPQVFAALGRDYSAQYTVVPVPEPATSGILGLLGTLLLAGRIRRK